MEDTPMQDGLASANVPTVTANANVEELQPDSTAAHMESSNLPFAEVAEPSLPIPDVSIPDASIPDAFIPDAFIPDASMPDASMPDAAETSMAEELLPSVAMKAKEAIPTPPASSVSRSKRPFHEASNTAVMEYLLSKPAPFTHPPPPVKSPTKSSPKSGPSSPKLPTSESPVITASRPLVRAGSLRRRAILSDDSDTEAKPAPKRKPCSAAASASSSSSSGSGSDSSSDESSSGSDSSSSANSEKHATIGGRKMRVKPKVRARPKPKARSPPKRSPSSPPTKRLKKDESGESSDEEEEEDESRPVTASRAGFRDPTSKLIASILSRWWYVLPTWPPVDFDWDSVLSKRKLKVVPLEEWEIADDIDSAGFTKVYPISHFQGLYRDPQGQVLDLRPLEGKPCYSTFKLKSDMELHGLLVTALKNQISELANSPYRNTEKPGIDRLTTELQSELKKAEESLIKLKRRKGYLDDKKNGVESS